MNLPPIRILPLLLVLVTVSTPLVVRVTSAEIDTAATPDRTPIIEFLVLSGTNAERRKQALSKISANWNDGDTPMILESIRLSRNRDARAQLFQFLGEQNRRASSADLDSWYRWIWNREIDLHPEYAKFKKLHYARIDRRFTEYFDITFASEIRLDEIRWGGVRRDGIPPLKNPKTVAAEHATYLANSDIVFGVRFGDQARAYPKRILAWHEMVKDVVGGKAINGVYCTLCGSMVVYDPTFRGSDETEGKHYELGTSGFLYRSNKLMYDHETKSMWSTLGGSPVVGPLVGKGIRLQPLHVVTTTWERWRSLHPDTDVLSLDTGHQRDYGEGVAYAKYFATDELMFEVPKTDSRLKNKEEVFVIRNVGAENLAFSVSFLAKNPILQGSTDGRSFVILTDETGASRAFHRGEAQFSRVTRDGLLHSRDGGRWTISEAEMTRIATGSDSGARLARIPSHRAFWFGWIAAFPDTKLIDRMEGAEASELKLFVPAGRP